MIRTLGLDRTAYADSLHPADPGDGLTAVDLEMVDRLGLDRAAYAAGKAAMGRDGF